MVLMSNHLQPNRKVSKRAKVSKCVWCATQ